MAKSLDLRKATGLKSLSCHPTFRLAAPLPAKKRKHLARIRRKLFLICGTNNRARTDASSGETDRESATDASSGETDKE